MMGCRPLELMELPMLERELAMRVAAKKEEWRMEQFAKMFGGQ